MPVKLADTQNDGLIPANKLECGQIAVVEDARHPEYCGTIVMVSPANTNELLEVGGGGNEYWFKRDVCTLKVRVLPPGTLLEVTE